MINRYHGPNVESYIIKFTTIYITIITIILFFISKSYALSFLIGGAVNILCFKMTVRTVDRVVDSKGRNAKSALVKNNVSKLSIYMLVLVLCGINYSKYKEYEIHLEIIPAAIAFLSVKIIIYFKYFVYDKVFKVKNFDDSLPQNKTVVNYKEEGENDGENY